MEKSLFYNLICAKIKRFSFTKHLVDVEHTDRDFFAKLCFVCLNFSFSVFRKFKNLSCGVKKSVLYHA